VIRGSPMYWVLRDMVAAGVGMGTPHVVVCRVYFYAHKEDGHDSHIADLWSACAEKESQFPEIQKVMSADMAASEEIAVLGGWGI